MHLLNLTFIMFELKHVFQQKDQKFIELLNRIRKNNLDSDLIDILSKRFIPYFTPSPNENYIILTTHNSKAKYINKLKLNSLPGKTVIYKAEIKDDFPASCFPTEQNLELKVGVQIMFIRNDNSPGKQYYNGKIGKIIELSKDRISIYNENG